MRALPELGAAVRLRDTGLRPVRSARRTKLSRSQAWARGPCHGFAFLLFILTPILARAQTISLPLEGYYRPGAYTPVAHTGATAARVAVEYGVAVDTAARAGAAPLLVLSTNGDQIRAGDQSLPLRALGPGERLVGSTATTSDESLASALFPGTQIVRVPLNATNALPGAPIAWDSLDAIIVDSIDAKSIPDLLATGMTLAVKSDAAPDRIWPWVRIESAWVLRAPTGIDAPALLGEEAYLPVAAWAPGRPRAVRQFVVLLGVLCGCVMLGIALSGSRRALPALALFAAVFCVGFGFWRSGRSEVQTTVRQRRIEGDLTQIDRWTFQTSPVQTQAEFAIDAVTWPVFASRGHAEALKMTLECDETGKPLRFRYTLPARGKMAFVTRTVAPSVAIK